MAIYSDTRQEIRHYVARLCNDLLLGTVASPASGTFVCTLAGWEKPDDYFNDWVEMFCYAGTGIATKGNPTDWDNTSHTLTFLPVATLTAGDSVEMHQRFMVNEYNDFINLTIEMVAKEALINKVDTSIDLVSDTYAYDLPTAFLYVDKVEMESGTTDVYNLELPIDRRYWRVVRAATQKLEFVKELWSPTDGRELRVTGLASPAILSSDSTECPINPTFIAYQAAALLHQSRIRAGEMDSEWHSQQMTLCQAMADKERPNIRTSIGGAVAVVEG